MFSVNLVPPLLAKADPPGVAGKVPGVAVGWIWKCAGVDFKSRGVARIVNQVHARTQISKSLELG